MRRIRLIVSYDGTNYCGWQIQENAVTVEGTLTDALRKWLKEDIEIIGASRTDSGVHAYGNIAVFDTNSRIPSEKFAIGLNHYLPEDIRVQKSDEVESDYHPRYRNTEKTYEYTILNTKINLPTYSRYSYHVYHPLDFEAMKEAAALLVGFTTIADTTLRYKLYHFDGTGFKQVLNVPIKEMSNTRGIRIGNYFYIVDNAKKIHAYDMQTWK